MLWLFFLDLFSQYFTVESVSYEIQRGAHELLSDWEKNKNDYNFFFFLNNI